jgi:4-amino-4-deoxy-L-arabinose transferase-like glycosyltransferase
MLLPWPLVLRGRWSAVRNAFASRGGRFAIAWVVPALIVFSLIGGKQAHYLLPLLPGVALLLAVAIDASAWSVRVGIAAFAMTLAGIALAFLPTYASSRPDFAFVAGTSPGWGVGVIAIGATMLACSRRIRDALWPALAMVAAVLLFKLAVIEGAGSRYDVRSIASQVAAAQERGQPIVHLGWHHGVYEFAGRLKQPLPVLKPEDLPAWVTAHPDGLVVSFYRRYRFRADPIYSQPFRGGQVAIWNAREALASGIDPNASHARDDSDDSSDDD